MNVIKIEISKRNLERIINGSLFWNDRKHQYECYYCGEVKGAKHTEDCPLLEIEKSLETEVNSK